MKKLTVLLVAVFAIGGLSLTAGCKSDCDKALANMQEVLGEDGSDEDQKKFLGKCEKWDKDQQSCMAGASDKKAMGECHKKGGK
jgi:hypothetical protein